MERQRVDDEDAKAVACSCSRVAPASFSIVRAGGGLKGLVYLASNRVHLGRAHRGRGGPSEQRIDLLAFAGSAGDFFLDSDPAPCRAWDTPPAEQFPSPPPGVTFGPPSQPKMEQPGATKTFPVNISLLCFERQARNPVGRHRLCFRDSRPGGLGKRAPYLNTQSSALFERRR